MATHVMLYHAAFLFVLAVNLPLIILTARGKGGNRKGAVVGRAEMRRRAAAPAGGGSLGCTWAEGNATCSGDLRRTGPACVNWDKAMPCPHPAFPLQTRA